MTRAFHSVRPTWLAGPQLRLAVLFLAVGLTGCGLVLRGLPDPTTLDDRLAMMPRDELDLEAPVTIRWNQHQVPYIEAASDSDGAYALGLVQAHLRLGQMELARVLVQARLAESVGPAAADLDGALRVLGFYRAASESVALFPPETRLWVDRFVAGINDYRRLCETEPYEVKALVHETPPWTPEDVIAIGRLASVDVNWFDWLRLLPQRDAEDWPAILAEALEPARTDPVSFESPFMALGSDAGETPASDLERQGSLRPNRAGQKLAAFLTASRRSGSNSAVVSGAKSASGAGMIASDPHLGFLLPNLWLMVGLKTPDIQVVGFMAPGLPIFGLGRTPDIAWGGTNLHAGSSELVDVSGLPERAMREEVHRIRRWGLFGTRKVRNRITDYGPVITDVELIREALGAGEDEAWALRWMGHRPSDEITPFLKVLRAKDFPSFRQAFAGFALPGQNMLYADRDGHIGHILAVTLPRRPLDPPRDLIVSPQASDRAWAAFSDATDLPAGFDPAQGYLASSNNRPTAADIPISYFFADPDRVRRASVILSGAEAVTVDDLKGFQRDVISQAALDLIAVLEDRLTDPIASGAIVLGDQERVLWDTLMAWDGAYRADAVEPLAFEGLIVALADQLKAEAPDQTTDDREDGSAEPAGPTSATTFKRDLAEDLPGVSDDRLYRAMGAAMTAAAETVAEFETWGAMHRLVLRYPLSQAPVVGKRFPVIDLPGSGSTETLMKTAHGPTTQRHTATYGSQARHVSDLGMLDENYFLLAGGQDGWLQSSTFADQMPLWQEGGYIRMPLSPEAVAEEFPEIMTLAP